jgi:hypothetical protein
MAKDYEGLYQKLAIGETPHAGARLDIQPSGT